MVEHEVKLYGAALNGTATPAPVLLARKDPDFLKTMLREVRTASGRQDLVKTKVNDGSAASPALLYQPVQRVMHMALLEAFCAVPGNPRLDPKKIDSAGVVIRRVPVSGAQPDFQSSVREAWMQSPQGGVGWVKLNAAQQNLDPDPKRRKPLHTGQSYLDQVLQDKLQGVSASEAVSPAFPAPPDVCADATKTLVFALLPLSSSELSSSSPPQLFDDAALKEHLPALLKSGNKMAPLAGKTITSDYASENFLKANLSTTDQNQFKSFLTLLNTLVIEFGIFAPSPTDESLTLRDTLYQLPVTYQNPNTKATSHQAFGDFLSGAKSVLLDHDPTKPPERLVMPDFWPQISAQQEKNILAAVKNVVRRNLSEIPKNRARFQNPERVYQLRAFIRVKHDDNCPPEIVWSDPSSYFKIAAWYDGPGVPTPPVVLPDLGDRNALKKLKPNVSFGVPASLFNAMQGASLDDLMKGKGGGGGGLNLDWICGFNIPIITICAFFVLNIFLSLLNIIFFWLPFVKICIPIPKGTLNSD